MGRVQGNGNKRAVFQTDFLFLISDVGDVKNSVWYGMYNKCTVAVCNGYVRSATHPNSCTNDRFTILITDESFNFSFVVLS